MDLAKVDLVIIREKSGFSEHVCETPVPTGPLTGPTRPSQTIGKTVISINLAVTKY